MSISFVTDQPRTARVLEPPAIRPTWRSISHVVFTFSFPNMLCIKGIYLSQIRLARILFRRHSLPIDRYYLRFPAVWHSHGLVCVGGWLILLENQNSFSREGARAPFPPPTLFAQSLCQHAREIDEENREGSLKKCPLALRLRLLKGSECFRERPVQPLAVIASNLGSQVVRESVPEFVQDDKSFLKPSTPKPSATASSFF